MLMIRDVIAFALRYCHWTSNRRCLPDIPFRPTARPSPNANSPALCVSSFSSAETSISPPFAWAAMRAARMTFLPKKSSASLSASPVCGLVTFGEGALDIDGALQSPAGALERQHEAVALRLHLEPLVGRDSLAHDGVVLAQQLQPALVAEALRDGCGALDVAEHDGDGAVGRGVGA